MKLSDHKKLNLLHMTPEELSVYMATLKDFKLPQKPQAYTGSELEVGELYRFPRSGKLGNIMSFAQPKAPNFEVDFDKPCLLLSIDNNNRNMLTLLCNDEDNNPRELYLHLRYDLYASPVKAEPSHE